jgi:hypothetical protein
MTKSFAIVVLIGASLLALWGGITLASQIGGGTAGLTGPVAVDLNVTSDPCTHDFYIWGSNGPHNMTLQVESGGSTILITSSNTHWVPVNGSMTGSNFEAAGSGTVAGIPNVTVTLVGSWDGTTLMGTYTIGAGNELPTGQCPDHLPHPAVYTIKPKPTPTATVVATGTPPKLYSIIVIKLNDDNLQPVPDWEIRLYAGPNCSGSAIDTKQTDADGMVDFEGLDAGPYSVREINRTGWNPVGATCKSTELPGALVAGVPACPIAPDEPFPQPGCDTFPSAARVQVRFNGTDTVIGADLGGPVQIERLNKPIDKDGDGLDEVNTEMVFMDLTGPGLTVRESPTKHSTGVIEEQHNITSGVLDFPANSFFDIFFEVDVGGMTLHNNTPLRMACKIDQVPPYKCLYEPPITDPVELLNVDDVKIAKLVHGLHIPIPPNEVVVIFTNRPKTTPTVTATRTPTPHEGTATATPTNPPPNGTCTKGDQNVSFQGQTWDLWKCVPNPPTAHFNRVDVFVGTNQPNPLLSAVHFVCHSTHEKVEGVFKVHKANVYPGTTLPNADIWSAEFNEKCVEGANVYVQPVSPAVHPVIVQVAFTDNQPTPTVTATPRPNVTPTPTPHPRDGDANKDGTTNAIDGALVLQFDASLIDSINDSADVNGDAMKNSLDALLILQFVAALIDHLPI